MSESGELKSGKNERRPGEPNLTRRRIVLGGLAAVASAGLPELASAGQVEREKTQAEQVREFNDAVEKEKIKLQYEITVSCALQGGFKPWHDTYTRLKDEIRLMDPKSAAYPEAKRKIDDVYEEGRRYYEKRGTYNLELLEEAAPLAKELSSNEAALTNLASARVLYREMISGNNPRNTKLPYWHNLAAAYLALESVSQEHVVTRANQLFEYARVRNIDVSTIPVELVTYCLIDHTFDFSLTSEALEGMLNNTFPTWKKYPPIHNDKNSYASYNNLSVLDVFELNRLSAVMTNLDDSKFVEEVFKCRDADVKDTHTGFGGVIPLPLRGYHLQNIPADEVGDNNLYVIPGKALVEMFASASTFRFNATKMEEPQEKHGPSADDEAFFAPGVVFSSIDDSTILVHFFTSTEPKDEEPVKNEVVCLGVIKRPARSPQDKGREYYLNNLG